MNTDEHFFPEKAAGGFTRIDGTIQFYFRVNALVQPWMIVADIGAGRGLISEAHAEAARKLGSFRGRVKKIFGVDIDNSVKDNPLIDEAIVYDGTTIPLENESLDLIISDYTFEHVQDPETFTRELSRILKPGGWICARTPNLYSALVVASTLIPNQYHVSTLRRVQPSRLAEDVFPTEYKLNSISSLNRFFPSATWRNYSYSWSPEPAYHYENPLLYRLFLIYQYLKKPFLGGEVMMIFLQKR